MELTVIEKDYCEVSVHYECSKDEIEKKRDEVALQFRKAPVKGARKGKQADMTSIRIQYAKQIQESLKRALAEQAFHDTIFEKDIAPFGDPQFTSVSLMSDKFTCDFDLRKKPEFELGQYKDLELPKPHSTLTAEAVSQELLQELRIRFGEGTDFREDDTVSLTDNVVVDYDVFDAADPDLKIEPLCGKAQLLTIGRSKLAGFDQSILGMKIGDTREFITKVPDFGLPSVADKDLRFVVSLLSASKITPCPLDDSLAVKMQRKDLADVMAYTSEYAASKVQDQMRQTQVAALSSKLVDDHDIKVPEWLTLSEAQYLTASAKVEWNTMPKIDQDQYLKMAEKNVKLAMVLDKIRMDEPETQLADQEVIEMVRNMLVKMGADVDQMMQELNKSGQLSVLSCRIRDEFALDFLVKNTKWIE